MNYWEDSKTDKTNRAIQTGVPCSSQRYQGRCRPINVGQALYFAHRGHGMKPKELVTSQVQLDQTATVVTLKKIDRPLNEPRMNTCNACKTAFRA